METLLLILAIVFALIIVLIVATLLIPADISLRLFKDGALAEVQVAFGVLMGIVSGHLDFSTEKQEFRLRVLGATVITKDLVEEKKEPTDWKKLVVNANELYDAGKGLALALTKNIAIKRFKGKMKVGLSDPYETGMLTGFLYAGCGIAHAFLPETEIEIEPSFVQEQMDADIELGLSLPLFKIVIPVIRFFRRTRKTLF
ncbi:MAG: DUF2953 domain-containing protein [Methanosarcinales archaeon]